jgi:hypothetical protein
MRWAVCHSGPGPVAADPGRFDRLKTLRIFIRSDKGILTVLLVARPGNFVKVLEAEGGE